MSNQDTSTNINTENIFDELSVESETHKDVEREQEREKKDKYFYIKKTNTVLIFFNIVCFLSIILFSFYYYIQTSEQKKEYAFLNIICPIFQWEWYIDNQENCRWIDSVLSEQKKNLNKLKEQQSKLVLDVISDVYSLDNFNLSKNIVFLLDRSENRLKPSEILTEFDAMKLEFSSSDKSDISCSNIHIYDEESFSIDCDIFSSDWDSKIYVFESGSKLAKKWWGTSISRAASFVDFLENAEKSPFHIVEKPKQYTAQKIQKPPYTQVTSISLKMKYIPMIAE